MAGTADVLAKLDPKTRKRLQMASEVKVEKQLTPSVGLNIGLGGGLAYGRQHLIWGNKSAGKSSFCLQLIAMAQKDGKSCVWVDVERTFDPEWAKRLGVNVDDLLIIDENAINKIADSCIELIQAGIDIIVIDSISDVLSSAYYDDDEIKSFEKTGQIGSQAKDLSKMSTMMLGVNDNTMIIMISQQTNEISATYTKLGYNGGNKVKHNSSTIIKLFGSESQSNFKTDKVKINDTLIDTVVGREIIWNVDFNKTAAMGPRGEYNFYFAGDRQFGVSKNSELVKLGIRYGIIKKSGAWYTVDEQVLQGEAKVETYLMDNPDIAAKIEEQIYAVTSGHDPKLGVEPTAAEDD
jgi:recombination protein RecA